MDTRAQERTGSSVLQIHGFSSERRTSILPKLHLALAAAGCWLVNTKRERHSSEYHFEIELASVLDLYCGLVHAGLQMTELTHHALTEQCMLRMNGRALSSHGRVVRVQLGLTFVGFEEDLPEVMAASAQGC